MWTQFFDLASGGYEKEKWTYIYIEAPEVQAITIFKRKFGHSPLDAACDCCGENYGITEHETLLDASRFNRQNKWDYVKNCFEYETIEQYKTKTDVLIISAQAGKLLN
jgi:hypothetical protein